MYEFSGYGFNKSHSAPYAIIGYKCAYFKTHYPHEFMSTLMTIEKLNTNKLFDYLMNLLHMKIKLIGPQVNKSNCNFFIIDKDIYFTNKTKH